MGTECDKVHAICATLCDAIIALHRLKTHAAQSIKHMQRFIETHLSMCAASSKSAFTMSCTCSNGNNLLDSTGRRINTPLSEHYKLKSVKLHLITLDFRKLFQPKMSS